MHCTCLFVCWIKIFNKFNQKINIPKNASTIVTPAPVLLDKILSAKSDLSAEHRSKLKFLVQREATTAAANICIYVMLMGVNIKTLTAS